MAGFSRVARNISSLRSPPTTYFRSSAATTRTTFARHQLYLYNKNDTLHASEKICNVSTSPIFRRPFSSTHSPQRDRYRRFGQNTSNNNNGGSWQYRYATSGSPRLQGLKDVLTSKVFIVIAAGGGLIYVLNLETVEATGRRRFNVISAESERQLGEQQYRAILQQYQGRILPDHHPYTVMVHRVMDRLIPHVQLAGGAEWRVHVIHDPDMANAFVLPSGKVFVFTGILPLAKDENGLAAILGHEISHVIARHPAERMSSRYIVFVAVQAISSLLDISGQLPYLFMNLFYSLPNSRVQEAEADMMGLMLMSEACFDPSAAISFWERMQRSEKTAPPQFISTHPSHYNRSQALREWLPQAENRLDANGCGLTGQYYSGFQNAIDKANETRW